ncbi:MAG: alcohol dehydrogenase catalytic domain-containing protein [Acetobacteraceae bacterium]|nr:alcohol dehydrogenase catalytic domain-containing protein [Acetobacteraceae bacterium]
MPELFPAGTVPGHECSGRIVALGAGAKWMIRRRARVRAPVLPCARCGECETCRAGEDQVCPRAVPNGAGLGTGRSARNGSSGSGCYPHCRRGRRSRWQVGRAARGGAGGDRTRSVGGRAGRGPGRAADGAGRPRAATTTSCSCRATRAGASARPRSGSTYACLPRSRRPPRATRPRACSSAPERRRRLRSGRAAAAAGEADAGRRRARAAWPNPATPTPVSVGTTTAVRSERLGVPGAASSGAAGKTAGRMTRPSPRPPTTRYGHHPTTPLPRPDLAATQRMRATAVTETAARRAERRALDGKPTSATHANG